MKVCCLRNCLKKYESMLFKELFKKNMKVCCLRGCLKENESMLEKKFHFLQICIFIHFLRPFKKHKIYLKLKKSKKNV